ncbi:MAG TPA: ABC transporter permease [Vicinamibacterales bacterium]|nr:ABC transporter permease [Vicinamibacterales bacterium]
MKAGDGPASGRGLLPPVSWLDWKLGARLLLKYPALTIIGGLSLAAAIAIGAVGIELAGELLYKRLPFEEGGRVVRLETQDTAASRVEPRVLHDFAIWRRSLKTVAELGAARVSERNVLTGEGRVELLRVAEITASAFPLTRVPPLLGRPLQLTDEMQGAEPVVVLGYDVWQRQFLHDPAIIGRVVTVGRTARTVVGVMPPRFGFPRNQQVWVPLPVQDAAPREGPAVQVFGRLADRASWQDAAAELDVVSARLAADQPATHAQLRTRVRAFAGRTPGDPLRLEDLAVHTIVLLLLGAVSANVATLIFARTALREPEMVVRHALGASRGRVIAQLVTEGLVLALAAAVLGLVVAQTTVRYAWIRVSQITGDGMPFWVDLTLEPATIAYALLLALVAAALIGLLPALRATGVSVQRGLQGITGTGGTMEFGGIWSFIVAAQVACTLLFVPAAVGIFTNSLHDQSGWAEFPAERYLTFRLGMDNEALAGEHGVPDDGQIAARRALAYEAFAGRLREQPGVTHVTHGDRLPTMSPEWVALEMEQSGAPPARLHGNYEGGFAMAAVGDGYHDAFGAKIVAGRGLHTADAGAPNRPVVVNEAFVRVVGRNPVGARVRTIQRGSEREPEAWHEIVGVVTDLEMVFPADWGAAAYIYRAASAAEVDPVVVAVRVAGDAAPLAPRVAALAQQVDAGLHLRDIVTLDDVVAQEQIRMVGSSVVFGLVLLVALVFSAAGLYALMSVAVARRTREIAIRIALGANPGRVLRTVFARAGRQLGGGILAGNSLILLLAWRADSLTAALLVSSVITSLIMAAVGVLACTAPARRALRVQPTEALRQN